MHVLLTPLSQGSTLLMALACVAAAAWGRWPERSGAAAIALDWIGSIFLQDRRWWHHGQPGIFALDIVLLGVMVLITLACRRTWLLWATACTLLTVLTHIAAMLDTRIGQWSYLSAAYVWSMVLVAALAVGVVAEGRKEPGPMLISLKLAPR